MLANTFQIILKQDFATSVVKVGLLFSPSEKLVCSNDVSNSFA